MDKIVPFDLVMWQPEYMGPKSQSFIKEKVYFIQNYLGKRVFPNFNTIWHFESKVAQSYFFKFAGIKTPNTFVSFDYHDALEKIANTRFPLVFKKSYGAASQNVRLVQKHQEAQHLIEQVFCQQAWDEAKQRYPSWFVRLNKSIFKAWFWAKIWQKISHGEFYNVIYWQEFIEKNNADLRITVIGEKYAFGFWRNNRPGDFRASGSGRLDYQRPIPEDALRYCIEINRKFGLDSMAYDLLFQENEFLISEMSYGYLDKAIYNAPGYYVMEDGAMQFNQRHTWPEELWVEWAIQTLERDDRL